jgi:hypothetical protein
MSSNIDQRHRRCLVPKGFDLGQQHVGDGRVIRTIFSIQTGEVFAEGKDDYVLIPIVSRLPSIANRFPSPSVEALTREVATTKGYDLVSRSSGGIAILDPAKPDRAISVLPFWRETLQAVLELRPTAAVMQARNSSLTTSSPAPKAAPVYPPRARLNRDEERALVEERERLRDAGEELEPDESVCPVCNGMAAPGACSACAADEVPPPIVGQSIAEFQGTSLDDEE